MTLEFKQAEKTAIKVANKTIEASNRYWYAGKFDYEVAALACAAFLYGYRVPDTWLEDATTLFGCEADQFVIGAVERRRLPRREPELAVLHVAVNALHAAVIRSADADGTFFPELATKQHADHFADIHRLKKERQRKPDFEQYERSANAQVPLPDWLTA